MAVSIESRSISLGDFYEDLNFSIGNISVGDEIDLRAVAAAMFGARSGEVVLGEELADWVASNDPERLRRDRPDGSDFVKSGLGFLLKRRPLFLRRPYYDFGYTPRYRRLEFLAAQLGLVKSSNWQPYFTGEDLEDLTFQLADFELALAQSPQLKNLTVGELLAQSKSKVAFFPLAAGLVGAGQQLSKGEVADAMLVGLAGCGLCLVTAGTIVGASMMLEYLKSQNVDPNQPPRKRKNEE